MVNVVGEAVHSAHGGLQRGGKGEGRGRADTHELVDWHVKVRCQHYMLENYAQADTGGTRKEQETTRRPLHY